MIYYNCQICGIFLYQKEDRTEGVSSGFCPHCYLVYTKLQEAMSDHRGVVSEVVSKILREYCSEIKQKIREKIAQGKYQGRLL